MAVLTKKYHKINYDYLSSLDPWVHLKHKDVEWVLKKSLLTSQKLVISDTQALYSKGFQNLLQRMDAVNFLSSVESDNSTPLQISIRYGATNFEDVLKSLLIDRERPAIFPWLSKKQQSKIDEAYSGEKNKSIGTFYDVVGKKYEKDIEYLDKLIFKECQKDSNSLQWIDLEKRYAEFVKISINNFMEYLSNSELRGYNKSDLKKLCDLLLEEILLKQNVSRSDLFRILDSSILQENTKKTLEQKLLAEPYHLNFVTSGGFNIITGSEYNHTYFNELYPSIKNIISTIKLIDLFEIDRFPLFIDQISFNRIYKIRKNKNFNNYINSVRSKNIETRIASIKELLNLIFFELSKEPKGLQRFGKIEIKLLESPSHLVEQFYEAGLSVSDLISLISKIGGFFAGEISGNLLGIFGLGGIIGLGTPIIIEQVFQKTFSKKDKKVEFQQVVQQLFDK